MPFGQLVIGPPGSGKTTYCSGMYEFLSGLGRKPAIVNLDPANDALPYPCAVNLAELVSLADVADAFALGPNGGLVYCLEYLEQNLDWLDAELAKWKGHYFLFDCPGQVELYTHHPSMVKIVEHLQKKHDLRLVAVHLVDSHHCNDAAKFVSVSLLSLMVMMRLELPHVSVLSKIDLLEAFGPLPHGLDFYTEMHDLQQLFPRRRRWRRRETEEEEEEDGDEDGDRDAEDEDDDDDGDEDEDEAGDGGETEKRPIAEEGAALGRGGGGAAAPPETPEAARLRRVREASEHRMRVFARRFRSMHSKIVEVIDDFQLVGYHTLAIEDKESVLRLTKAIDKANGYVFGALHASPDFDLEDDEDDEDDGGGRARGGGRGSRRRARTGNVMEAIAPADDLDASEHRRLMEERYMGSRGAR